MLHPYHSACTGRELPKPQTRRLSFVVSGYLHNSTNYAIAMALHMSLMVAAAHYFNHKCT